jgi:cell division septation protein DedD
LDISGYIQDLLWDYECVIIPGFGGILATYHPAEMVLAEHVIYPPAKYLAFNEYLTNSDGLLINHICRSEQISYTDATEQVETWVKKTKNLLINSEEIYLPKIGRFHRDVEKKLRFEPDTSINYLASAYGLRKVIAEPILRNKSADTIEVMELHRASYTLPKANKKWAMAAVIILFLALGTIINLMYQGVDVKPLNLNAASVLGFLENFQKPNELNPEPKVSINNVIPTLNPDSKQATLTHIEQPAASTDTAMEAITPTTSDIPKVIEEHSENINTATGKKYYIIIGSFKKRANFQNAAAYLKDKHPNDELFEDTSLESKRVGFYAGDNYQAALDKLKEARKDQQDYWLIVKR